MAVSLDGSTYLQRTSNLKGISSSQKATFAVWFNFDSGEGGVFLAGGPSIFARFQVSLGTGTGKLAVTVRNAAGTLIYAGSSDSTYQDADWHHFAFSLDLSTQTPLWYVDGASVSYTDSTSPADDTIDFAGCTEWDIGAAYQDGGVSFNGAIDDLIFKAGTALDLTDADVLRKLVSSDGNTESQSDQHRQNPGPDPGKKQVGYGVGGFGVFDPANADVLFTGCFHKNLGDGGSFSLVGAWDSSRGPDIYRSAALRPTPGERWFESEQSGFSYPRSEMVIERREGIPASGKRIGMDEVDDRTRQETPGMTFSQIVMGRPDREDDSEDDRRE